MKTSKRNLSETNTVDIKILFSVSGHSQQLLAAEIDKVKELHLEIKLLDVLTTLVLTLVKSIPEAFKKEKKSTKGDIYGSISFTYDSPLHRELERGKEVLRKDIESRIGDFGVELTLNEASIANQLKIALDNFALAVQIAYPRTTLGVNYSVVINNKYLNIDTFYFNTDTEWVIETAHRNDWPQFKNLSLKSVWDWLYQFEDIWIGFSETQVGRVINALKYMGVTDDKSDYGVVKNLVWSMVALETLFVDDLQKNDDSIASQITKKVFTLLGKLPKGSNFSEKHLKKLYTFRSNFFHGRADFPSPDYPWDADRRFDDGFIIEWSDVSITVTTILIRTLQLLAKYKLPELRFELGYKLVK